VPHRKRDFPDSCRFENKLEFGKRMELPERKIYTVSELTEQIRDLLEREFPSVWIQGEVSNLRTAPSGHVYFTLKDEVAQIRCVMFKLQRRFLKFRLEDGLHVIAWGRISVYSLRGEYQLILDTMEPVGLGSLMLAFEQLKKRLTAEGLFDEQNKKPLPPFPKRIGLVTSSRGAAVRDMIRISRRRFPGTHILVSPASVQGDRAPDEIVAAIDRLCNAGDVDVIIVGRGGGSIEDLWAFNDEKVVRAVAGCPLPVVSAVGHETDVTLTDFAADLRASTPSAAAEMVVPDKEDLQEGVIHLAARMKSCMRNFLERRVGILNELLRRLYDPRRQIQERRMRLDDLTIRLGSIMRRKLEVEGREIEAVATRLRPEYLTRGIQAGRDQCSTLLAGLLRAMRNSLKECRSQVENISARLDGLSPLSVLARGYSITVRPEIGTVISDAAQVRTGDEVLVRLHRGELTCQVTARKTKDDSE
jgi:exodeoxyribonuclease VII large subunit